MKRIITILTILLMLSLGGCSVNINDEKADKQEGDVSADKLVT